MPNLDYLIVFVMFRIAGILHGIRGRLVGARCLAGLGGFAVLGRRGLVGLLPVARIGGEVARRGKVFGMKILAYDPYVSETRFEEVGVDVTRYFFLMRRAEAQLTFDLDLALDHSEKNPVYKLQYAHARMASIFRKAGLASGEDVDPSADLALLTDATEEELMKILLRFPEVVGAAAERHTPHSICEYLEDTLAPALHPSDPLRRARHRGSRVPGRFPDTRRPTARRLSPARRRTRRSRLPSIRRRGP